MRDAKRVLKRRLSEMKRPDQRFSFLARTVILTRPLCRERRELPLLSPIDKLPELARASIPSHSADCISRPASRSDLPNDIASRCIVFMALTWLRWSNLPVENMPRIPSWNYVRLINFHASKRDEVTAWTRFSFFPWLSLAPSWTHRMSTCVVSRLEKVWTFLCDFSLLQKLLQEILF